MWPSSCLVDGSSLSWRSFMHCAYTPQGLSGIFYCHTELVRRNIWWSSKLFGDPRNYLVILELPCKFRTHRLDKKDSSRQISIIWWPSNSHASFVPTIWTRKTVQNRRDYLVTLELPCKFRTHRLDKKDSSRQISIIWWPSNSHASFVPTSWTRKTVQNRRDYLVTLELACKFRIHMFDKKYSSKQKSIIMNMSFLCVKGCSLPWLFWIIGELKKVLQWPVDHNSLPDFLCLSESLVKRSFPVLGKLGFCLFVCFIIIQRFRT